MIGLKQNKLNFIIAISISIINFLCIINASIPEAVFNKEGFSRWIFYYHVPIAWNASLAFLLGGFYSLLYLLNGKVKYDNKALACSELGALFGFLVLFSGFIWASPAWGTNWTWEPRLTTTLMLELIYLGYFMIKAYGGSYEKTSIYRAYISIMALAMLPIIYYSVKLLPQSVQAHPGHGTFLEYGGLRIFIFSLISFSVLLFYLYQLRINRLEKIISSKIQSRYGK